MKKRMMAGCALALAVTASAATKDCVEVYALGNNYGTDKLAAPSLLPAHKNFKLVWNDEFNGTKLDETKWSYRTNFWGQSAHWFAKPEDNAVEVKDGLLYLKVVVDDKGQYKSPQLQTGELIWDVPADPNRKIFWPFVKRPPAKFMHRYGYYECRCRLQQKPGWWSAFWMQTPSQGASLDPEKSGIEHDIMESFEVGELIPLWFHYNGYGAEYRGFKIDRITKDGEDLSKVDTTEFHTYGLLWEPDGYTAYQDGKQIGPKVSVAVSQCDQFVLLSTEVKWYRNNKMTGKGAPELKDAVGDAFVVDFVRVYDIVEK